MVGQLSGSAGSTTASRNRYGSYFRTRNIPVNPNTEGQQFMRGLLASLNATWKGTSITKSAKIAWANMAAIFPRTDGQGNQIILSGQSMFIATNLFRNYSLEAAIATTPPAIGDSAPVITDLSVDPDLTAGTIEVALTGTGETANNWYVIYATPPISLGREFVNSSEYRVINRVNGTEVFPLDITTAYEAVFGEDWALHPELQIGIKVVPAAQGGYPSTETTAKAQIHA